MPETGVEKPRDMGWTSPPKSFKVRLALLVSGGVLVVLSFCLILGRIGLGLSERNWPILPVLGVILLIAGLCLLWKPMATKKHTSLLAIVAIGTIAGGY